MKYPGAVMAAHTSGVIWRVDYRESGGRSVNRTSSEEVLSPLFSRVGFLDGEKWYFCIAMLIDDDH